MTPVRLIFALGLIQLVSGDSCDVTFTSNNGTLDITDVSADQTCTFTFLASQLYFTVAELSLGPNSNLTFYNGTPGEAGTQIIRSFAGSYDLSHRPFLLYTPGANTSLVYNSGSAPNATIYEASIHYSNECQVTMETTEVQLSTPFYQPHDGILQCSYTVTKPANQHDDVLVAIFDLRQFAKGHGSVYDGPGEKTGTLVRNITAGSTVADVISSTGSLYFTVVMATTQPDQRLSAALTSLPSDCVSYVSIPNRTTSVSISSPSFPHNYTGSLHCRYIVQGPESATLKVTFTGVQLTDGDTLTLRDGGSLTSPSLHFSTDQSDGFFLTSGPDLWIDLSTDELSMDSGFNLTVQPLEYGGRLYDSGNFGLEPTRNMSSPEDTVFFQLVTSPGLRFVVELNSSLTSLYPGSVLEFHEGLSQQDVVFASLTFQEPFYRVFSLGPSVLVEARGFFNNESWDAQTFLADFRAEQPSSAAAYSTGPGDVITWTGSDVTNQSVWLILKPEQGVVALSLLWLNLPPGYSLTVYRGLSEQSLRILHYNTTPAYLPQIYVEDDVRVSLTRSSDSTAMVSQETVLFHGSYHVTPGCGQNFTNTSLFGVLSSPNFPDRYPLNARCDWSISTPRDRLVHVTFTQFQLASNHTVILTSDGKPLATYSGKSQFPNDVITNASQLLVQFSSAYDGSDSQEVAQGYKAQYAVLDCGGNLFNQSEGSIVTPRASVNQSVSCAWLITVPATADNKSTSVIDYSYEIAGFDEKNPPSLQIKDGASSMSSAMDVKFKDGKVSDLLSRYSSLLVIYSSGGSGTKKEAFSFKLHFKTHICTTLCGNGVCLHKDWRCNGVDECGDESDEKDCSVLNTKYRAGKRSTDISVNTSLGALVDSLDRDTGLITIDCPHVTKARVESVKYWGHAIVIRPVGQKLPGNTRLCAGPPDFLWKFEGWMIGLTVILTFVMATIIACAAPYVYRRLRYRNYSELRDLMAPVPT